MRVAARNAVFVSTWIVESVDYRRREAASETPSKTKLLKMLMTVLGDSNVVLGGSSFVPAALAAGIWPHTMRVPG
jgi:hypothetical protein